MTNARILILDPDTAWTLTLSELFTQDGFEVLSANTLGDGLLLLDAHRADVLVVDLAIHKTDTIGFLERLVQIYPQTTVIVHTSHSSLSDAVAAVKLGVVDYLEKSLIPSAVAGLREKVNKAVQQRGSTLINQKVDPRNHGLLSLPVKGFFGIISQNRQMREIFELIQTIADSYANVLVQGETGTGKELIARAIHEASNRHGKPFVTLDCSTLSRELLESELFGHEKGAFTGAVDRHIGRFERANGGTLFLDEVSNIDFNVQAKLLRVLQTRSFERVGGQKSISVDVRIVAATNQPLDEGVAEGTFREDLYHRLNVVEIELPPLRNRLEDIPLLAMEFMRRFSEQNGKSVRGFTDAAINSLCAYHWPGNVRELENVVLQSVVLAKSPMLDVSDLPKRILEGPPTFAISQAGSLSERLGEPEKDILINTLRQNGGNVKRTAQALQVSRTTLYAKFKKYQINPDAVR
jgi:DNA-binding NtrC family response regulator